MSPTDKNQVLTLGLNDTLTVPFILNNIGEEPSIGSKVEFSFTKYFELIKDSAYTCKMNGQQEFARGFETGNGQSSSFSYDYDCELNGKLDNGTSKEMSIKFKLPNELY